MDGYGEGSALSYFSFRDGRFELLHQVRPAVSLGLLYGLVTQFCGFNPYDGEEWKVMGLAAFGEPREPLYRFFRDRIVVDGLDPDFRPSAGRETAFDLAAWAELEHLAGGFRRPGDDDVLKAADLAHNFQRCFEEVVVELAHNLFALGLSKNLAFTGGCALNSAANGRIVPQTGFERLHVPCAPGDDGNALGAVLFERHHVRREPRTPRLLTPYLGSNADLGRLEQILGFGGIRCERTADEATLVARVADKLVAGRIVAWMQGRAEFGPRALGNRSILADPRDPQMRERINARVKFREFYRPLAPSILAEHGAEYFEDFQPSPYMERTLRFRPQAASRVPAVVHRDGTGRLQTVTAELNPLFHALLSAFHAKTGVPVLLNTSFNVMGKPIVHSVEDALATFFTSGLDDLVIGPYVIEK
jgi:carbamoyltransferase